MGTIVIAIDSLVAPLTNFPALLKFLRGWITNEQFFQGLGLAQSMPGPLFNFSSFLGATYKGVWGAIVAELALFGPGYILIFALVPFWSRVRHWAWFKAVLKGVNAAAIGLIGSGC